MAYGLVAEVQADRLFAYNGRGTRDRETKDGRDLEPINNTPFPFQMPHPFWPTDGGGKEVSYDDFTLTLEGQCELPACIEYRLKLTMVGSDAIHYLVTLRLKAWPKNDDSPSQMVAIARDVIAGYKKERSNSSEKKGTPIVLNCLTGSKRSAIVSVAMVSVLATQSKRPLLINVIDSWFRIASQRRGVLQDVHDLELSYKVVLSNAYDLLNKRKYNIGLN